MPPEPEQKITVETDSRALKALSRSLNAIQKKFRATQKISDRLTKSLKQQTAQYQKLDKVVRKSISAQTKAIGKQKQLVTILRQTTRSLRKQRKELRDTTSQTQKASKATQGLFSSLRSVGALLGLGSVGFLAVRRIKSIIDKRFNLALTGGAGQLTTLRALTGGRNTTAAIDLSAKFQRQSDFARFGLGGGANKGLVNAQRALEKVGLERANAILLAVTDSLEPDRLARFIQVADSGDIRGALLQAASGQNVGAVTTALNALDVSQQAEKKNLDPLLQAATEFAEVGNRLGDSFDRLTDTVVKDLLPTISKLTDVAAAILGKLGGVTPAELAAGAAAVVLAPTVAKGAGKVALRGAGRLIAGRGAVSLGAGALGLGAAGAFAGGSLLAAYDSIVNPTNPSRFNLPGRAGRAVRNFFTGEDAEIERLQQQAERQSQFVNARGLLRFEGPETKAPESPAVKFMDLLERGAKAAKTGIDDLGEAMNRLEVKALEANLTKLQQQAAKRVNLELSASEQSSLTQLRRLEFEVARTTPLGTIGAIGELNALNKGITAEIARLAVILTNIDTSTKTGAIEANGTKAEILKLRLERKQNDRVLQRAVLDSVLAQAFIVGRFSKIIINREQNLAIGLEKGIIPSDIAQFTGSVDRTKPRLKPRRVVIDPQGRPVIRAASASSRGDTKVQQQRQQVKNSEERLKMDKRMLDLMLEPEQETVETTRPTAPGGRMTFGG